MTKERSKRARPSVWTLVVLVAVGISASVSVTVLTAQSANEKGATAVLGVQIAGPNQVNVGDTPDCVLDDVKQLPNAKIKPLPVCPKTFGLSGSITGLYPGAHPNLPILITNQNNQDIKVTQVQITVTSTNKAGCAPATSNLLPTNYTGPGVVVHANSSSTIYLPITMPNTVANACQDATFQLSYGGSAVKP